MNVEWSSYYHCLLFVKQLIVAWRMRDFSLIEAYIHPYIHCTRLQMIVCWHLIEFMYLGLCVSMLTLNILISKHT